MRKVLLTAVVVLTVLELQAQFGFFFGFGYGCGSRERLGTEVMAGQDMYMESPLYGSLGTALNVTLGADYELCDHGGVGVEVDYVLGIRQTVEYQEFESSFFSSTSEAENRNTAIQVVPYAFIRAPFGDTWSGFGRVGPVVHFMGENQWHQESTTENPSLTTTYVWEEVTKQRIALGVRTSVGLNYKISDHISLDLEAFTQSLGVKTKSTEVTMLTENGDDLLDDLDVYEKMIDYVDKLDENSNNSSFNDDYDVNDPKEELVGTHILSKSGLRLGVRLTF